MSSKYVIIQFVPDTVKDERINIGAYVYDAQSTFSIYLKNWDRIHIFAPDYSLDILKNITERLITYSMITDKKFTEPGPYSIIYFTKPRSSVVGASLLVNDIYYTFFLGQPVNCLGISKG